MKAALRVGRPRARESILGPSIPEYKGSWSSDSESTARARAVVSGVVFDIDGIVHAFGVTSIHGAYAEDTVFISDISDSELA